MLPLSLTLHTEKASPLAAICDSYTKLISAPDAKPGAASPSANTTPSWVTIISVVVEPVALDSLA